MVSVDDVGKTIVPSGNAMVTPVAPVIVNDPPEFANVTVYDVGVVWLGVGAYCGAFVQRAANSAKNNNVLNGTFMESTI